MESLELRPAETALVVIDLQKAVVAMETAPHPAKEVVANSARLADAVRGKGGLIVLVRVTFGPDGKDMLKPILDPGLQLGLAPVRPTGLRSCPSLLGIPKITS